MLKSYRSVCQLSFSKKITFSKKNYIFFQFPKTYVEVVPFVSNMRNSNMYSVIKNKISKKKIKGGFLKDFFVATLIQIHIFRELVKEQQDCFYMYNNSI